VEQILLVQPPLLLLASLYENPSLLESQEFLPREALEAPSTILRRRDPKGRKETQEYIVTGLYGRSEEKMQGGREREAGKEREREKGRQGKDRKRQSKKEERNHEWTQTSTGTPKGESPSSNLFVHTHPFLFC